MKVKEWMEQNNIYIPPSSESENKEERKYGKILDTIRKYLQQPDESFDTIDKRKEYIEVKHIIEEIDSKKVLKELVEEDISKREMLEKAKKLEASYEKQLKDKKKSKDVGDSDDE